MDFECSLIEAFHWSPYEIGKSDIDSLISVAFRMPAWRKERTAETNAPKKMYADQVEL